MMISPDDMLQESKKQMLGGREPATSADWQLLVNFWALNVASGLEEPICILMAAIYEVPLTTREIVLIAAYQGLMKEIR